jgi:hypothetical protein
VEMCFSLNLKFIFAEHQEFKVQSFYYLSALHTAVVCRFCHLSVSGLVKLRGHYQSVHPLRKSSQKEETNSASVRCQTYHVCGQCDYKTNQVCEEKQSNLNILYF